MISIMLLANAKELAHPNLENLIQNKFERAAVEISLFEGTKLKQVCTAWIPPTPQVEISLFEGTKLKQVCVSLL